MNRNKGFSILELVMVIVITTVIVGVPAAYLKEGLDGYFSGQSFGSLSNKAANAILRITKDLENTVGLTTISATTLTLTRADGTVVSYSLTGANLNRNENSGTNYLLTNQVSALAFTYYDSSGAVTAVAANVRLVTISLTLQGSNPTFTYPLITTVYLRSM